MSDQIKMRGEIQSLTTTVGKGVRLNILATVPSDRLAALYELQQHGSIWLVVAQVEPEGIQANFEDDIPWEQEGEEPAEDVSRVEVDPAEAAQAEAALANQANS